MRREAAFGVFCLTTVYPTDTTGLHGNSGGKSAGKDVFPSGKRWKRPEMSGKRYSRNVWEPVVDGDFLPTSPVTENGFADAGRDIPLLIGSNLNEWTVMGNPMGNPNEELSRDELNKRLNEKYGDKGQAVLDAFKKAYPNESETSALYVDNTLIRLPILKLTAHKADQNGAPVYSYVFTFGTSYHTAEIPFVFNNIDKVTGSGDRADAEKLSDLMGSAWINFARSGNPNGDGIPTWEPYTREKGAAMIFDNESYQTENHDKELMKLLAPDYEY